MLEVLGVAALSIRQGPYNLDVQSPGKPGVRAVLAAMTQGMRIRLSKNLWFLYVQGGRQRGLWFELRLRVKEHLKKRLKLP